MCLLEGSYHATNGIVAAASMDTVLTTSYALCIHPLQVRQEMRRESGRGSSRNRKGQKGYRAQLYPLLYGHGLRLFGTSSAGRFFVFTG